MKKQRAFVWMSEQDKTTKKNKKKTTCWKCKKEIDDNIFERKCPLCNADRVPF